MHVFSANNFNHAGYYKFTTLQQALLKNLAVATGVIDDIDALNKEERGKVFELIVKIRNKQKLKAWSEKYNQGQISDKAKRDAFLSAAASGDLDCMKYLIEIYGETYEEMERHSKLDPRSGSRVFAVGVALAVLCGDVECVRWLVENEKYAHYISEVNKIMGIKGAAGRGHLACLVYLIEKQRSITQENKREAFIGAANNGQLACVKFLFEKYEKDILELSQNSALSRAASKGHMDCVKYLLETCKEISLSTKSLAPLRAAEHGKLEDLQYFIKIYGKGIIGEYKEVSLQRAAQYGHLSCVQYLIETYGQEMTREGMQEAYNLALAYEHTDIQKYLNCHLEPFLGQRAPLIFTHADSNANVEANSADTMALDTSWSWVPSLCRFM